jgi:acetyl esterase/lipase
MLRIVFTIILLCRCSVFAGSWDAALTLIPPGSHATGNQPDAKRIKSRTPKADAYATLPQDIVLERDLPYLKGDGYVSKLDLYRPRITTARLPVILKIHGGGLQGGDKSWHPQAIQAFVHAGYAVAAINYRMHPDYCFPAMVEDSKAAVRWLRGNADKYSLDAAHIGVTGDSAGGYLAGMLGTLDADLFNNVGEFRDQSPRVQAAVPWFGAFALLPRSGLEWTGWGSKDWVIAPTRDAAPDLYRLASPIEHLSADDPPMLLFHGDHDVIIPISQSQVFLAEAKRKGVQAELVISINGDHQFRKPKGEQFVNVTPNPDVTAVIAQTIRFFDAHLKPAAKNNP